MIRTTAFLACALLAARAQAIGVGPNADAPAASGAAPTVLAQEQGEPPPAGPPPATLPPAQQQGPTIVLPPDEPAGPASGPPPAGTAPPPFAPALPRGIDPTVVSGQAYATDLGAGRRIPIGAYGEAMFLSTHNSNTLTLRRVVLFFGYHFTDWVSVYSELEVENVDEFEIEQSYLELKPLPRKWHRLLGVRAGLVLIPLGIINQYHEPPTFNGVDRPLVDQLIIPSTWRELGVGIFGTPVDGLHYQLYIVDGADGAKFTADGGIGPGLSRGFQVNTENAALTGRINYNRILGLDLAAGFYYGTANDKGVNLQGVSVGLVEADARFTRWGLSLRGEYAHIWVQGADKITQQVIRAASPSPAALGSEEQGGYVEAGYNVLYPLQRTEQQVVPFARYEYVDTRSSLPKVMDPVSTVPLQFMTVGVTYKPIMQLAFKFDYRRTLAGNDGTGGNDRFSIGIGFMY